MVLDGAKINFCGILDRSVCIPKFSGGSKMILTQSKYQHELKRMIEYVEKKAYNSYVEKFVEYPSMDLFQLHFTYLFLSSKALSPESKDIVCIPQLFIQLALDSHEQVGEENLEEHLIKNRQLTVLSGDYFSSFYYLYLANRDQVEYISKWSNSIQAINELKAEFHEQRYTFTKDERFTRLQTINGLLTTSVLDWFHACEEWYALHEALLKLLLHIQHDHKLLETAAMEKTIQRVQNLLGQLTNDIMVKEEIGIWMEYIQKSMLVIEP